MKRLRLLPLLLVSLCAPVFANTLADSETLYEGPLSGELAGPVQVIMRDFADPTEGISPRLPRAIHKALAEVDWKQSVVLMVAGPRKTHLQLVKIIETSTPSSTPR